jgi:hypothetical protein
MDDWQGLVKDLLVLRFLNNLFCGHPHGFAVIDAFPGERDVR